MGVKGDDCFMGCRRPFPIGAWVNVWSNCFSRPVRQAITNVCNSKKGPGHLKTLQLLDFADPQPSHWHIFFLLSAFVKSGPKQ